MDILDILKKYNISVPDDQVDNFNKDFRGSYKSAAEHKKVKDDLTAAQTQLSTASEFEGKYNTLFRKYETDMAAKQAEIDSMNFDKKLDKALSGVEFINNRIKDSVLGEIRSKNFKINEQGDIEGLSEFIKGLKDNEPDIFKDPKKLETWAGGSNNNQNNKPDYNSVFNKCN